MHIIITQHYNNYKQENMKKKNLYERPSLEVVVLDHKEMLMTSGETDKSKRTDYGDAIEDDWEEEEEEE